MSIESKTSRIAFNCFAVDCLLNGIDARVILDRSVDVVDEDGQIVDRVTIAQFLKEDGGNAQFGQTLVVGSETFTIGRKQADDGYIVSYEVHKQ